MNTRDLQIFLEVYKWKNITKAASGLFLSAQSVSKTIRKLENELGIDLFQKTTSGPQPTQEAELLHSYAKKLIDEYENLQNLFKGTTQEKKIVKVATTTGVFRKLGLEIILDFYEHYPFIKLEINENLDPVVDELCWNETVDLCFNSLPFDHNRYESYFLLDDPYACILNKNHPLAFKGSISYKDLEGYPLAIQRSFRFFLNRLMYENFTPNIIYETIDASFLDEIASNNLAVSIGNRWYSEIHLPNNCLIVPFEDTGCKWDCYLLTKRGKVLSAEAQIFTKFILEVKDKYLTS